MLLKRGRKIQFLVKFYNTKFCINFSAKVNKPGSPKDGDFTPNIACQVNQKLTFRDPRQ